MFKINYYCSPFDMVLYDLQVTLEQPLHQACILITYWD